MPGQEVRGTAPRPRLDLTAARPLRQSLRHGQRRQRRRAPRQGFGWTPQVVPGAPAVNADALAAASLHPSAAAEELRVLSFNIQTGIRTDRFHQYLTRGWRQLLPDDQRDDNLRAIAEVVRGHDVVALQEIDGGSLRSGFTNQVQYLAEHAGFPYFYAQANRDLGALAQHGNGMLSRWVPRLLEDHKLPGFIPGRGAIVMEVGPPERRVTLAMLHLSLGKRTQDQQLAYLTEVLAGRERVVLMGDLNSHMERLLETSPLRDTDLTAASVVQPTYPAWRPSACLDHVLVSPDLDVLGSEVIDCRLSDHRPVAVRIAL